MGVSGMIAEFDAGGNVLMYSNTQVPFLHKREFAEYLNIDPARIRIPFMGHFATLDTWCTPAAAASLEADMRAAGQAPEIHHYVAQHAFFNNSRRAEVYDEACASLAWSRTTAFFARHLLD